MRVLTDTGAYGCHAVTVTGNTGHKAMALYVGDGQYRKTQTSNSMPILFTQIIHQRAPSVVMGCPRVIGQLNGILKDCR